MRNYIFLLLTVLSLNTIGQDIIFCGTQSNNTFFSYDPITRNSNLITPGQTLIRRIRVDQNLEQVFWSAGALNKIQKVDANLVGSNRVDVKTNLTNVATINVAAINNKVYYHLGNGSAIFSCDTNGNNTSTLINLGGSKLVLGIEIDIDNSFIYWTEITPSLRTIRRANLITGGNQTTIYSSTDLLFDIKLLAEDSSIYFTNRNGNKVQKIKTDGTGLQTIVDEPNSFTIGTISGDYCNNVLYYYLVGAGNGVQIKKVALNSTTPSVVLDTSLSLLNGLDVLFQFNIGKKENFLGPNRTICFADSTTLNAKVRGGSYLWNNNSTSSALKVKQSGMYSVTVTAGNCAKVDSITVTVNTDFTVDVGVDSILCFGDSIVLDATMPSASYLWSDNSSAATLKVKQTGTFWADVTVNGCTKRDSITINIDPSIQPTLGNDTSICFGDSITLNTSVTGAANLWNDNSTNSTLKVKQSGIYSVTVTAGNCTKVDSITVTVNPDFTIDIGVDSTLCFGDSIVLDATTPSASYLWSVNSTAATLKVKQAGTFWADVTVNGCTKRDSITINIDPSIQPTLGNDTSICFGDSITLNTSVTGAANLWNDNSTNSTLKVKQSGIYSVTVTAGNCTKVDSITITVNPNFTVDIGVDTTLCFNDSILLNATTLSASYLWSNNSTTSGLQISSKGTYWVDVSVNGCTKRDSISIIIHDELPLFLGNDTTICFNDSVQFNLDFLGYSYLWSDGSTDSVFTIKREGAFWADLTLNGCVTRDSIYVSIFNSTLINLGNDTTLCFGDSIILNIDIPPPVIVKWSDNSTNSSLKVKSTGFYYVDVTLVDCTIRDSIAILFTSEIGTNFFPNDTTLCNGDSIDFDFGQPNQSYLWSDSTTISSNTFKQEGLYWLEISENGCASRDSLSLRIKEQPIINLGPDTSLCEGELFGTSYSNLNTGYLWNTGSNDTSIAVKTTGIYWLEVLLDGCIFRDSIALQVKPIPSIDLGPDTTLCFGDTIALSQSSFTAMYLWNDSTTGVSIETFRTGNYWLDFTVNGCSTRDSIRIETFDSLGASFLPQTATLCGNGVLNYQLPLQNSNYRWQDGSLDPNYSISDTGLYFVQVSNTCGSRTDSLQVTKDCECKVSMPNAFTPNNDLINDQFIARISCELEFYAIEIYNRWGGKVFESVQQKQAWDGTINGRKPKNGVYYYVLRYKTSNENVQTLKGSLLLSQ